MKQQTKRQSIERTGENAQCANVGQIQAGRWAEVGILTRVQMQLKACLVGQGVVQLRAPGRNAELQASQLAILGRGAARLAQLTQTMSVLRRRKACQKTKEGEKEKKGSEDARREKRGWVVGRRFEATRTAGAAP